jgi:hypothetical protein
MFNVIRLAAGIDVWLRRDVRLRRMVEQLSINAKTPERLPR